MDDILKLAKDYSKERHLDLLPRCNNNILDKLDYIYMMKTGKIEAYLIHTKY